MYHVTLLALIAFLLLATWNLVHVTPRALLFLLPQKATFIAGAAILTLGIFLAFAAAVLVQNGGAMVAFMLKGNIGLWLMLAHWRDDEDIIRRAFLMMGAMLLTIVGIFYLQDPYGMGILMALLLGAGYYVLTGNLRFLDRGR